MVFDSIVIQMNSLDVETDVPLIVYSSTIRNLHRNTNTISVVSIDIQAKIAIIQY